MMAPDFSKLVSKFWKRISKRNYALTPRKYAVTSRKYSLICTNFPKRLSNNIVARFLNNFWIYGTPPLHGLYNDTEICPKHIALGGAKGGGEKDHLPCAHKLPHQSTSWLSIIILVGTALRLEPPYTGVSTPPSPEIPQIGVRGLFRHCFDTPGGGPGKTFLRLSGDFGSWRCGDACIWGLQSQAQQRIDYITESVLSFCLRVPKVDSSGRFFGDRRTT